MSTLLAARMLVILALMVTLATILTRGAFADAGNLVNVLRQVSFEATIAFAMTLVIITGGIDLAVGSMIGLTGVVAALVLAHTAHLPLPIAITPAASTAALGGGLVGAGTGAIVAWCTIPPFIVTLAVMLIARSLALIISAGQLIYDLPEGFMPLGRGFVFESLLGKSLPVPVVVMPAALASPSTAPKSSSTPSAASFAASSPRLSPPNS